MSAYFNNLYAALRTRISGASVWPDVVAGGIHEAEHAELTPWINLASALPYGVIAVHGLQAADWGLDNQAYIAQVDIWRVQEVTGPSGTLVDRLEALRDDLYLNQLTVGQVLPQPGMALRWDMSLQPNQIFAQKSMEVRAGRLSVAILLGETM